MAILETQSLLPGVQSLFKDLIRVNLDCAEGFRFVSQNCHDGAYQAAFRRLSEQAEHLGDELSEYVEWNGGETILHGTSAATVYRAWIALRERRTLKDIPEILPALERIEKHVEQAYAGALEQLSDSHLRNVLQRHLECVRECCNFFRQRRLHNVNYADHG